MKNATLFEEASALESEDKGFPAWLERVRSAYSETEIALLAQAYDEMRQGVDGGVTEAGELWTAHALGMVKILADLHLDAVTLLAALLLPLAHQPTWSEEKTQEGIAQRYGNDAVTLIRGTLRMQEIHMTPQGVDVAERNRQAENLRKMLLSMVEDIRIVLIKLAERLQTIRRLAFHGDEALRQKTAREVADLFAPLANRLGVWQVKWELEDLSLRILEPDEYRRIAILLDERQVDRQRYIENVIAALKNELASANIKADITGRPKHIYSIWNKMRRKQAEIDALYDIRAVRILVDDVKDCYTVLGLVHHLWTPLPREFDDYIAKPKANNYRSLHTAVIGPEDKSVEVQIRTWEMHQHSEYGVAAHWRYKEKSYGQTAKAEAGFEEKIAWLRQILEWKDLVSDEGELLSAFKSSLFTDIIYVLTPQGKVVDLPSGSTPIDFAYSLHTNLGHRCRGAKVNGQMVPLNHVLKNGQRVEIVAVKQGAPSRDWLNTELRFVASHRARSKIRQWFNHQQIEETISQGRAIVEKELARAGASLIKLEGLASQGGFSNANELFVSVGRDEINQRQLQQMIQAMVKPGAASPETPDVIETKASLSERQHKKAMGSGGVLVVGVDRLMTSLARCCKPAPPDAIVGFVTREKGVTVHRCNCENIKRIEVTRPERLVEANWGDTAESVFAVDIMVDANDRPGLLRDLSEVFSREKVRLVSVNMQSRQHQTRFHFTAEVKGLSHLQTTLKAVREITGVVGVERRR
ncbi:MAG: bifunctional (p)ppGpp synthetase/guanosine-3',5'-bis(diphosphate) 3'-pyrophosphohydrolase [Burkholderiales bacterium]|jgi:GTP pyrophosphokinase|nr:bifunctional (p)ppGpp synthetase/guanosine-3',5'-bis(diphosphate) 3'-pyrophosphohydrolase [Burkholderiales bacterium]